VYYLWLIFYVLLLVLGRSFLQSHMASGIVPTLGFETWSHFLYLQNFVAGDYVAISAWCLGATWSLAVEEQFYLVAPLAVRFLNRRTLTGFLMATVAAAPLIRLFVRSQIPSGPDLTYTLMFCRADALALGMLIAIAVRDEKWKAIVLGNSKMLKTASLVLAAGMIAIWIWAKNPRLLPAESLGYTWIAFFYGSILLLSIALPAGPIAKACRTGFLRELGRVSYCMYIIHLPVQLGTWMLLTHRPPELFRVRDVMAFIAALGITYGVARVSWIVLEHPMLQIGHRWHYGEQAPVVTAALSLDRNV
jgi:peptidoglycan/LPS O-acetylase OafA/YrhL